MSPLWGFIAGIVTLVVMLAFIGIWVWAWLPNHKTEFDVLAALPMEDEIPPKQLASPRGASALGRPGSPRKDEA
jgi:cytochrome c oxidase cbb3-type subunit 4